MVEVADPVPAGVEHFASDYADAVIRTRACVGTMQAFDPEGNRLFFWNVVDPNNIGTASLSQLGDVVTNFTLIARKKEIGDLHISNIYPEQIESIDKLCRSYGMGIGGVLPKKFIPRL